MRYNKVLKNIIAGLRFGVLLTWGSRLLEYHIRLDLEQLNDTHLIRLASIIENVIEYGHHSRVAEPTF